MHIYMGNASATEECTGWEWKKKEKNIYLFYFFLLPPCTFCCCAHISHLINEVPSHNFIDNAAIHF